MIKEINTIIEQRKILETSEQETLRTLREKHGKSFEDGGKFFQIRERASGLFLVELPCAPKDFKRKTRVRASADEIEAQENGWVGVPFEIGQDETLETTTDEVLVVGN